MAKVEVLEPDRKFLSSSGVYIYPKIGDIVDLEDSTLEAEIDAGNVEPVEDNDEPLTNNVTEQQPSIAAHIEKVKKPKVVVEKDGETAEQEIDKVAPPPKEIKKRVAAAKKTGVVRQPRSG